MKETDARAEMDFVAKTSLMTEQVYKRNDEDDASNQRRVERLSIDTAQEESSSKRKCRQIVKAEEEIMEEAYKVSIDSSEEKEVAKNDEIRAVVWESLLPAHNTTSNAVAAFAKMESTLKTCMRNTQALETSMERAEQEARKPAAGGACAKDAPPCDGVSGPLLSFCSVTTGPRPGLLP